MLAVASENSSESASHSVTLLIQQLKDEDADAAGEIWRRYFQRLLPLARSRLKRLPVSAGDAEDVLVSVFDRFFRAAQEDRFARLDDRDDLWQLLLMLTERKVTDEFRKWTAQKRGGGNVVHETDVPRLELDRIRELADHGPPPEVVAAFNENLARALDRLAEGTTREVALLRMEGYANKEIAEKLGIALSSIERKLRVVREVWAEEFGE
jgi:DNA-directed RNA polymerase specialized sigma24 family protein